MQELDLTNVEKEIPEIVIAEPLSGIKKAGFSLALITLSMMTLFIVFIIIFFFAKDLDASSLVNYKGIDEKTIAAIIAEKKAYRDFVLEMSKTVLLNLLLPILTAILGYIFGSSRDGK